MYQKLLSDTACVPGDNVPQIFFCPENFVETFFSWTSHLYATFYVLMICFFSLMWLKNLLL